MGKANLFKHMLNKEIVDIGNAFRAHTAPIREAVTRETVTGKCELHTLAE